MKRPLQRPNRLTSRLYAYRHAALFLIFLLIVQLFNVLEQTVVPRFWVECSLDQYIPFIPVFVVPYVFWFLYVGVGLVFLCLWDKETFVPTIFLLCAGMAIALLIYAVFPHGQPLRPAVTGTDPFSVFIRDVIYANDTNTNCCPSIHVLNQLAVHAGICHSRRLQNRRGIKAASLVATVLVCASTMLIKQHSILDVAAALLLELPLYWLFFRSRLRLRLERLFSDGKAPVSTAAAIR